MVSSAGSGSEVNHLQWHHSRFDRAAHTRRQAATQIEPQDHRNIDGSTQYSQAIAQSCVDFQLRDFAGLESPERICGPLPDQTRIRPYFWNESDSGVPSESPPKLTGTKKTT